MNLADPRYVAFVQPFIDRHVDALSGPDGVCCDHVNEGTPIQVFAFARLPGVIVCFECMPLLRVRAGDPVDCDGCGIPAAPERPIVGIPMLAGLTHLQVDLCPECRAPLVEGP